MAVRLSVNINEETAAVLKELAERKGTTVTEIIRRAVSVYKFVEDEVGVNHRTLQLAGPGDNEITTVAMVG